LFPLTVLHFLPYYITDELWGMELGMTLREIKRFRTHAARREELRDIGYDLDTPGMVNGHRKNFKYSYEHVKAALIKYKEINGDMKVMVKFTVPIGDDAWPRETWGLDLGRYVQLIRGGKAFCKHRFELATLGFAFDSQRKYGYDLLRAALKKYAEMHGSLMPKYNFVVPRGDPHWPKSMWGMNLGSVVQDIKKGECYRDKREELEAMGFVYPPNWPKETKKARKKKRQLEEAGQQGLLQMARI
jgi:hypothetical protein